ncbi:MAG: COX15/CtaA family protein [Phycisphaerae bacterium]|nr:COX15/CtaA family protein [Gemmatimonadaceae bacterium]
MTGSPAAFESQVPGAVRVSAYVSLGTALLHLIFGAIVRISGSGMGCGNHWPKCYGLWFPPFDRMDLVVEVVHRYLATILGVAILILVFNAWRYRQRIGVGGAGGVWRASLLALLLVLAGGGLGAVTVITSNTWWATVAHLGIAISLIAVLVVSVIRAGGFGTDALRASGVQSRAVGGTTAAAVMALLVVLLGGMTAKVAGAAVACVGFPLCGDGSLGGGAQHLQLTHRIIAYLLVLHLCSLPFLMRKRGEPMLLQLIALAAMMLGLLQIVWAAWMILGGFPPIVRSFHQATGILIWTVTCTLAYTARVAAGRTVIAVNNRSSARASAKGALA